MGLEDFGGSDYPEPVITETKMVDDVTETLRQLGYDPLPPSELGAAPWTQHLRVIVESPFLGGDAGMKRYLRLCMLDSIQRGEAPYASHRLYPGVLDDGVPEQRQVGLSLGHSWRAVADVTAVYVDYGISPGMRDGITTAQRMAQRIVYRRLYPGELPSEALQCR
jgi:hypothetical protein